MIGLIDSHCHLDRVSDLQQVLAEAQDFGLSGMVTIGTRLSCAAQQRALTQNDTPDLRVWCTVGTHPDHVDEEGIVTRADIIALTEPKSVIGIGETGLDYLHGAPEVRTHQADSFRAHIGAARATGLPVIIHARDADHDVAALLEDEYRNFGPFPFLLHCFASSNDLARTAIDLGGYISFSGLLTFPKCGHLRDIARQLPAERLLVETDSPYLAPVPHRGKPNTPGWVTYTASCLAQVREVSVAAMAEQTTQNFYRLFSTAR